MTAETEPDLFWGLRGGKGALGIVTALEFDLLPHAEIYAGAVYFDAPDSARVARAWAQWCTTLPPEATTSLAFMQLPPIRAVPEILQGTAPTSVRFVFTGPAEEGERLLAPIEGYAQDVRKAMAPWSLDGTLPNFAMGTGTERFVSSYDAPTSARLAALAAEYDPAHVFRVGQVPRR